MNIKTLAEIKEDVLCLYENQYSLHVTNNYPLFSFAYASFNFVSKLYSGLQIKRHPNEWLDGDISELILTPYFLLEHLCQIVGIPEEATLLKNKDSNVWVIRNDRFLPKEWPDQVDSSMYSMLHVAVAFAIKTYSKARTTFERVDLSSVIVRPQPSKELLSCLQNLTSLITNFYKNVDFNELQGIVQKEIEYEFGLFVKQKYNKVKDDYNDFEFPNEQQILYKGEETGITAEQQCSFLKILCNARGIIVQDSEFSHLSNLSRLKTQLNEGALADKPFSIERVRGEGFKLLHQKK